MEQFDLVIDPQPLDSIVILQKPYPVDAGTVVGYLGEYQRYREADKMPLALKRPLMHVEVFAGSDLPAFIKRSQARAKQLPDKKAFLESKAYAETRASFAWGLWNDPGLSKDGMTQKD